MKKDRIVGVLREARGLRKNKSGKAHVSESLAAKKKTLEKAQGREETLSQAAPRLSSREVDRSQS